MRVLTGAAGCLAGAGYILVLDNCFLEIAAASAIHYVHDHFTISWARTHPRDSEETPFERQSQFSQIDLLSVHCSQHNAIHRGCLIARTEHTYFSFINKRENDKRKPCESLVQVRHTVTTLFFVNSRALLKLRTSWSASVPVEEKFIFISLLYDVALYNLIAPFSPI